MKTFVIPGRKVRVGDTVVEFGNVRVEEIHDTRLGDLKMICNNDTATIFLEPSELVTVERPNYASSRRD
jgi:hypothetical protein